MLRASQKWKRCNVAFAHEQIFNIFVLEGGLVLFPPEKTLLVKA
jgi:hypothetical protein